MIFSSILATVYKIMVSDERLLHTATWKDHWLDNREIIDKCRNRRAGKLPLCRLAGPVDEETSNAGEVANNRATQTVMASCPAILHTFPGIDFCLLIALEDRSDVKDRERLRNECWAGTHSIFNDQWMGIEEGMLSAILC